MRHGEREAPASNGVLGQRPIGCPMSIGCPMEPQNRQRATTNSTLSYASDAKTVDYVTIRRLATANRSRVSIRGQTCKIYLTSSFITLQNLAVVFHTVCVHAYIEGPKNGYD